MDINVVTYNFSGSSWDGDGVQALVLKAPVDDLGGAIRIVDAYVVNGAATGAGTGWSITLQNRGVSGTATATDISDVVGGTASPFSANVPKQFTVSAPVLAAGEWLGFSKAETNSSDPTNATLVIHYAMGN
jgi:hypothetical protein